MLSQWRLAMLLLLLPHMSIFQRSIARGKTLLVKSEGAMWRQCVVQELL